MKGIVKNETNNQTANVSAVASGDLLDAGEPWRQAQNTELSVGGSAAPQLKGQSND